MATSCSWRATADLYGGMSVRSAAGAELCADADVARKGLRSAGGARRVTVPPVTVTWRRTVADAVLQSACLVRGASKISGHPRLGALRAPLKT